MKKLILTLAAFGCFAWAQAQNTPTNSQSATVKQQKTPPSPDKIADRDASHIAKELGLSDDSKAKVRAYALERANANHALREKEKTLTVEGDKKALHQEMKANKEKFYANVNGLLTPDQQTKWAQMRQERMDKHKAHKGQMRAKQPVDAPQSK